MKAIYYPLLLSLALTGCSSDSDSGSGNSPDTPAPDTPPADTLSPTLSGIFPANGHATQNLIVPISGTATDNEELASVVVKMDQQEVTATLDDEIDTFRAELTLVPGENTYQVTATDAAGNQTTENYTLYFGKQVTGGGAHSGLLQNGKAYVWGRNNKGQLGMNMTSNLTDNPDTHPTSPVELTGEASFVSLAFNQNSSLALANDGSVWSWGYGKYGQLGLDAAGAVELDEADVWIPTKVGDIDDAVSVVRGYYHAMVLHVDGTVSTFGRNSDGQLGDGGTENSDKPIKLNLNNIVQIAAASSSSYAVDNEGRLWGWGANDYGNLGLSATDFDAHPDPVQIPLPEEIDSVAAGRDHVLALARSGKVYAWGLNASSQVGQPTNEEWPEDVTTPIELPWFTAARAVWANGNQSFVERADGKVYPWGQNMMGTLGIEVDEDVNAPDSAIFGFDRVTDLGNGALHTLGLRQDEEVFAWGWSFEGSLGGGESTINLWAYRVPVLLSVPAVE